MDKFLNLIFGTTDLPTYLAGLLFALIGLAFYYHGEVAKRNVYSKNTPISFSWVFFTQDNLLEMIFSLLSIFLALRFSVEYSGVKVTMFYSLGIGWGFPKFIAFMSRIQDSARDKTKIS